MHKNFYASGFLYHPPTQQILLQQTDKDEDNTHLSLFSVKRKKGEDPTVALQRIIQKKLKVTVPLKAIHEVYDYTDKELEGEQVVTYAEVADTTAKKLSKSKIVKWFPLKQLAKLNISEQTRQDIIVGQRVINYVERQRLEQNGHKEA